MCQLRIISDIRRNCKGVRGFFRAFFRAGNTLRISGGTTGGRPSPLGKVAERQRGRMRFVPMALRKSAVSTPGELHCRSLPLWGRWPSAARSDEVRSCAVRRTYCFPRFSFAAGQCRDTAFPLQLGELFRESGGFTKGAWGGAPAGAGPPAARGYRRPWTRARGFTP